MSLSASRNALVRLPDSIGDCKSLRHLDVCRNKLMRLPESLFAGCAELEELWARDNQLVFMPGRPGIPKTIRLAKRLRKLDVGGNRLTSNSFPPLDALVALEGLWLSDNNLTHLPKGLAGCANLRVLKVDGNRLESIGFDEDGIPAMRSLEILSAKDNALQRVGRALGRSPTLRETLKELDLTGNRLPGFPASIGRLQSLFAFRVIAGNSALNPYKRRLLAGPNGAGEHTIGSNASVDSKASARAARALANALDYLEKVDDELRECDDWHPGLRDRERAERSNRKGRLRRRSVWGLWEGTGARGGFDAPLDGGPGLNGLGKEGEHEVQQRKLHLVMAFTKKSRRKRGDEGEDGDGDEKSAPGDGDGEKGPGDGARERHAKSQKITRQIRRGSELDDVMKRALRRAPVLDVMSDDDLNLLANRGFTMHRFAPGAPVTAAGDEREETRVMYVVVEGSVEETRAWNDVISQAVPETLADRVAKAGRTIIFGASAPADSAAAPYITSCGRTRRATPSARCSCSRARRTRRRPARDPAAPPSSSCPNATRNSPLSTTRASREPRLDPSRASHLPREQVEPGGMGGVDHGGVRGGRDARRRGRDRSGGFAQSRGGHRGRAARSGSGASAVQIRREAFLPRRAGRVRGADGERAEEGRPREGTLGAAAKDVLRRAMEARDSRLGSPSMLHRG